MRLTDPEIIQALKDGKKIRRQGWCGFYSRASDGLIYHNNCTIVELCLQDLETTDWEIIPN